MKLLKKKKRWTEKGRG